MVSSSLLEYLARSAVTRTCLYPGCACHFEMSQNMPSTPSMKMSTAHAHHQHMHTTHQVDRHTPAPSGSQLEDGDGGHELEHTYPQLVLQGQLRMWQQVRSISWHSVMLHVTDTETGSDSDSNRESADPSI